MKILFVCHRFPYPPKRGGKIRPFNIIRHLHQQGHQISVVSITRSPQESADATGIEEYCTDYFVGQMTEWVQAARMISRLPTRVPSSMGYFYSRTIQDEVDRRLDETSYDLIFVHCSSVAQYVEHVEGIPKILDFGDMDSQKWQIYSRFRNWPASWGYWLEGHKLEAEEKRLAKQFDICTCTTRLELDTLNGYQLGVATDWFPNGVDTEYFSPDASPPQEESISFIGRMDYYPNQECVVRFCEDVFPKLRRERPDLKFVVVGADPPRFIRDLGALQGVTVTGSVPDVRPYVRASTLMVAPLNIARGTQNKILEAMAMGVPVVCSQLAAGGIDAVPEEHFLSVENDDAYVPQILRILQSPAERDRLASAGRQRVISHHNWPSSMVRVDKIIARCLNK